LARVREDATVRAGRAAVVQGDLTLHTTATVSDTAELVSYRAEEVVVRTRSQQQALLVLSDTAYPGWQATVDGTPAAIYTTNVLFRGVLVPAGEHVVRFTYQPASWRWGVGVSSAGLLLWLCLFLPVLFQKHAK